MGNFLSHFILMMQAYHNVSFGEFLSSFSYKMVPLLELCMTITVSKLYSGKDFFQFLETICPMLDSNGTVLYDVN